MLKKLQILVPLLFLFISGCKKFQIATGRNSSDIKVINGKESSGTGSLFPYVLKVNLWDGAQEGSCSGTFLNDHIFLTAAHCVRKFNKENGEAENIRSAWLVSRGSKIFGTKFNVHEKYLATEDTQYDIALIIFPDATYASGKFDNDHRYDVKLPTISKVAPVIGDTVKMVGFGSTGINIFTNYCKLESSSTNREGKCRLMKYHRESNMTYTITLQEEYTPAGNSTSCTEANLKNYIATAHPVPFGGDGIRSNNDPWSTYMVPRCFKYSESGFEYSADTKTRRMGENTIVSAGTGTYSIERAVESDVNRTAGEESITSPGDSGGGYFIKHDTEWTLVGVHSSGIDPVIDGSGTGVRESIFVNILYKDNRCWLEDMAWDLDFTIPYETSDATLESCTATTPVAIQEDGATEDQVTPAVDQPAASLVGPIRKHRKPAILLHYN